MDPELLIGLAGVALVFAAVPVTMYRLGQFTLFPWERVTRDWLLAGVLLAVAVAFGASTPELGWPAFVAMGVVAVVGIVLVLRRKRTVEGSAEQQAELMRRVTFYQSRKAKAVYAIWGIVTLAWLVWAWPAVYQLMR